MGKHQAQRHYSDIRELLEELETEHEKHKRYAQESPWDFLYSMLFPDNQKFEIMDMNNGTVRLVPNRQRLYLYRGQTKKYPTCVPALYRNDPNEIDLFTERLKSTEFEMVLRNHPAVEELSQEGLSVDFLGLAQHYGLKTDLIDLTSDVHMAAFFAVCEYSTKEECYVPVRPKDGEYGVLFKVPIIVLQHTEMERFGIVGLQPFRRPGEQKAHSFRLDPGEDFEEYAHPMLFRHSKEASEEIYERFEGGAELFPYDPVEEKAKTIRNSQQFSRQSFDETRT